MKKLDRPALEKIAKVFSAFSDPTRLAILQELKERAKSVGELVTAIGVSQGNMSKQLQLLHEAGVLEREKVGNQVFYSVSDELVMPLCELVCDKLNRDAKATAELNFSI
ncbi:MAG: ArsR/SmtB family transcription factor [Verrucomicrobiales bacterium]